MRNFRNKLLSIFIDNNLLKRNINDLLEYNKKKNIKLKNNDYSTFIYYYKKNRNKK